MKKPLLAIALSTLLLGGFATAAAAEVLDPSDVITADDEAKLDRALSRLGNHTFVVEFVDHASDAPSRLAKQLFRARRLGERDGVIVVATGDKKVGEFLGAGFERHGVDDGVISQHNKSDFIPYAKKGQYARGAAVLAEGLVNAGVSGGGRRSGGGGGGFPWGLVLFVAAGGGAVYWWMNRAKGDGLPERLEALRASQGRIVEGALKLAEVDQLARFQEGDIQKAYQRLAQNSNDTLSGARSFGDRFDNAEAALKAKKYDDAAKIIGELEREVDTLEPNVAASLTALSALEAGGLTGQQALAQAELPKLVRQSSRKLRDLRSTYTTEVKRARTLGLDEDPQVKSAIDEATLCLTKAPVDVNGADAALAEAEQALDRYKNDIELAAERKAEEDRRRAAEAAEAAQTAAILSAVSGNHHHHHYDNDNDYSSSSSSSWGSSSDDSWGSSSDSSWDSGGSSSDDNW